MHSTAAPPTVILASGVSKRFTVRSEKSLKERIVNFGRGRRHRRDFWALDDVSLSIKAGDTVGLLGANGSGKSTLLKVIGGIIEPSSGTVRRRGRLAALLELGAGFHPDLTGRENVFLNAAILGLSLAETRRLFDPIVEFAEIGEFIDTQVKFYSSGMYVRLAFAIAVHIDPDVLLVDEVLAVGDERFQRKCIARIRDFQAEGRTIVLVSHSASQVEDICDRGVVLDHGRLVYDGTVPDAVAALRRTFASGTQGTIELRDDDPRNRARIEAVHVELPSGTSTPLRPGDGLRVTVEVASDIPVDAVHVGVALDSATGTVVFATNTGRLGVPARRLLGRRVVEFDLPDLHLANGQYLISGSLSTVAGGVFARLTGSVPVEARTVDDNVGLIAVDATVSRDETI